jgi:hypothetical protein
MKKILLMLALLVSPLSALDFGVAWDLNNAPEVITGCKLYEKTIVNNVVTWNLVATAPSPVNFVDLVGIPAGTHVYAVTAFSGTAESPKSAELPLLVTQTTFTVIGTPNTPLNIRKKTP